MWRSFHHSVVHRLKPGLDAWASPAGPWAESWLWLQWHFSVQRVRTHAGSHCSHCIFPEQLSLPGSWLSSCALFCVLAGDVRLPLEFTCPPVPDSFWCYRWYLAQNWWEPPAPTLTYTSLYLVLFSVRRFICHSLPIINLGNVFFVASRLCIYLTQNVMF
jgi:hypothetical protein